MSSVGKRLVTGNGVLDVTDGADSGSPVQIHTDEGSPWPKVSDEFDAKMMEFIKQPFDYKADNVKMSRIQDNGDVSAVPAASRNLVAFSDLRDMTGRPVVWKKRYYIKAANTADSNRKLDHQNNKKKVVFNPKWHNGLHLHFDNTMLDKGKPSSIVFGIRYPGGTDWRGSDWLAGDKSNNDVILGKNQLSSMWMFESAGIDSQGHQHYRIFTAIHGIEDVGGFLKPTHTIAQAGYDKDWEWRTYEEGYTAKNGFFTVKFERFDYNE